MGAAHRRARYASPEGLGQAFNFDLLQSDFDATAFRTIVTENLAFAREAGSSSTWVLSNHDVVRHASRYALPAGADQNAWLLSAGKDPEPDTPGGLRRARAATTFILALPGSTYLYQGEELGLAEVADIPAADLQDPTWVRSGGEQKGRDGCRVPLPWTAAGPPTGSAPAVAPAPASWFADVAVDQQDGVEGSTLELYRQALAARRRLQGAEELEWLETPADVVAFTRPGGWTCLTNFGDEPVDVPAGASCWPAASSSTAGCRRTRRSGSRPGSDRRRCQPSRRDSTHAAAAQIPAGTSAAAASASRTCDAVGFGSRRVSHHAARRAVPPRTAGTAASLNGVPRLTTVATIVPGSGSRGADSWVCSGVSGACETTRTTTAAASPTRPVTPATAVAARARGRPPATGGEPTGRRRAGRTRGPPR